jgi:hypothetical protein
MWERREVGKRGVGLDFEGRVGRVGFYGGGGRVDGRYGEGVVCVPCEYYVSLSAAYPSLPSTVEKVKI